MGLTLFLLLSLFLFLSILVATTCRLTCLTVSLMEFLCCISRNLVRIIEKLLLFYLLPFESGLSFPYLGFCHLYHELIVLQLLSCFSDLFLYYSPKGSSLSRHCFPHLLVSSHSDYP